MAGMVYRLLGFKNEPVQLTSLRLSVALLLCLLCLVLTGGIAVFIL